MTSKFVDLTEHFAPARDAASDLTPEQYQLCEDFDEAWIACRHAGDVYTFTPTDENWQAHVKAFQECADLRNVVLGAGVTLEQLKAFQSRGLPF